MTITRKRNHVSAVFEQLGPLYTRRAYRMTEQSFYKLHQILFPFLRYALFPVAATSQKVHRNGARNGLVPSTTRLAVALR
jgi:hypothetical protein